MSLKWKNTNYMQLVAFDLSAFGLLVRPPFVTSLSDTFLENTAIWSLRPTPPFPLPPLLRPQHNSFLSLHFFPSMQPPQAAAARPTLAWTTPPCRHWASCPRPASWQSTPTSCSRSSQRTTTFCHRQVSFEPFYLFVSEFAQLTVLFGQQGSSSFRMEVFREGSL